MGKPLDYFANETLLFNRQAGGELTVLTCFPNTYQVGMASLGYQTVFKLFASNPKTHTVRAFTDVIEQNVQAKDIGLMSFSISWELDFYEVMQILDKLGIPFKASERGPEHPLIFAGGPVVTANPEPWAEFFDFIAIGDSEALIEPIIDLSLEYQEEIASAAPRNDTGEPRNNQKVSLRAERSNLIQHIFSKQAGLYVPSLQKFFTRDKNPNGTSKTSIERIKTNPNNLAGTSVIAPDSYWQDTYLLEVVRSCPEMCKFCLASFVALPFRAPKLESDLIPKIEEALKHTHSIGLLGASVTQHPEFIDLLEYLSKLPEPPKVQVASVRASTVTPEMTDLLKKLKVESLTIAIESGSEKLREEINKKLPQEYIYSAAKAAHDSELRALKLYGMVGLPTETEEDLDLTIDLLLDLKKQNSSLSPSGSAKGKPGLKITYGCSVFTPKMQTPYEGYRVDEDAERKLKKLQKALKPKGIDFRPESFKWAKVQEMISIGDRSTSDLMHYVYKTGKNSYSSYKKYLKEHKTKK